MSARAELSVHTRAVHSPLAAVKAEDARQQVERDVPESLAPLFPLILSLYLHTTAHEAAVEMYLLSLTGNLPPQDEPLQLLKAAIERGKAKIEHDTPRSRKKRA